MYIEEDENEEKVEEDEGGVEKEGERRVRK